MADISDLFDANAGSKKNNNLEIAALLRILAKLLDENEETDTNTNDHQIDAKAVLTRPHFTPSNG